MDCECE